MITRNQLKQYRSLKLELSDIDAQIQSKCISDSVQGSMKDYPHIKGMRHIEGVPAKEYSLLFRKSDLKAKIKEIEEFVEGIEDAKVLYAIRRYYLDPVDEDGDKPSWNKIADKFNDGSTAAAVKQLVWRYLKNIS